MEENSEQKNTIRFQVPNTRFWCIGVQKLNDLWDVYLIDPNTNCKETLRSNAKTSSFALFASIFLKADISVFLKTT
jgi:hypothetical protein